MSGIILRSRAPFKICDSASLLHYFNTVLVVLTKEFVSTISVLVLSPGQPELQHSTCRLDKRGLSPLFLFLPCLLDNQHLSSWQRSLPPLFSVLALSHRQPLNPLSWSMPIPCIGSTMLLSPDNTTRSCSTWNHFRSLFTKYKQMQGPCLTPWHTSGAATAVSCTIQTSALSHYTIHPVTSAKLSFTTEICTVFWYTAFLIVCASITFICLCAQHHSIW